MQFFSGAISSPANSRYLKRHHLKFLFHPFYVLQSIFLQFVLLLLQINILYIKLSVLTFVGLSLGLFNTGFTNSCSVSNYLSLVCSGKTHLFRVMPLRTSAHWLSLANLSAPFLRCENICQEREGIYYPILPIYLPIPIFCCVSFSKLCASI